MSIACPGQKQEFTKSLQIKAPHREGRAQVSIHILLYCVIFFQWGGKPISLRSAGSVICEFS